MRPDSIRGWRPAAQGKRAPENAARSVQIRAVPPEPAGGRGQLCALGEYQERYGLDIPEWRVLATLGFRNDACSAQYIAHCTRTHKSTISRAVTALMKRQMVERVENADDRREFRLRLTRKGKALYEELIPRLLRKEQEILSCLSAPERKNSRRCSERSSKALIWCRPARRRMRKRRIEPLQLPSMPGCASCARPESIRTIVVMDSRCAIHIKAR